MLCRPRATGFGSARQRDPACAYGRLPRGLTCWRAYGLDPAVLTRDPLEWALVILGLIALAVVTYATLFH
jgi:hypothetical protein